MAKQEHCLEVLRPAVERELSSLCEAAVSHSHYAQSDSITLSVNKHLDLVSIEHQCNTYWTFTV